MPHRRASIALLGIMSDRFGQSQPARRSRSRLPPALIIGLLVCILLLLYLWSILSAPRRPPFAPSDDAIMGMVIRDPWYDFGTYPGLPDQPNRAVQDRMGAMLAEMGVQWVRLEFHIDGGDLLAEEQIARNDYFIREVAPRYHLKVLGLLGYGLIRGQDPRILAAPTFERDPVYGAGIDTPRRIWLNRARLIVERYKGDVAAYQVLNEPNRLSPVWNETLPAAEVARLHTTFYTFFRHTDRALPGDQSWRDGVSIILGAIQPAGSGVINEFGYLPDTYYLRQLYASDAFQNYFAIYETFPLDGLGYHLYPVEVLRSLTPTPTPTQAQAATPTASSAAATPEPPDPQRDVALMMQRLDEARQVLEEVGDPLQPFWMTEIGHNAAFLNQTPASQAAFLRLLYSTLAQREDVARIFWFKYEDFPPASGPDAQQWGSVVIPFVDGACPGGACYDVEGRPALLRPAFWNYRELAGRGAALPEPPAQVVGRGPLVGIVHTPLTFTAAISRPTATQPLTYSWQINGQEVAAHNGSLSDTITLRWDAPGTYRLTVEASNAAGSVIDNRLLRVYLPQSLRFPALRPK